MPQTGQLVIDGIEQRTIERPRSLDVERKGQRLPAFDIGNSGAQCVDFLFQCLRVYVETVGARGIRGGKDSKNSTFERRQLEVTLVRAERGLQFLQRYAAIRHGTKPRILGQPVLQRQLLGFEPLQGCALREQLLGCHWIGFFLPFDQRYPVAELLDRAAQVHCLAEQLRGFIAATRQFACENGLRLGKAGALQQLAGMEKIRRRLILRNAAIGQQVEERHQQPTERGGGLPIHIAHKLAIGGQGAFRFAAAREICGPLRLAAEQRGRVGIVRLEQADRLRMISFDRPPIAAAFGQIGQLPQHLSAQPQDRPHRSVPNTRQLYIGGGQMAFGSASAAEQVERSCLEILGLPVEQFGAFEDGEPTDRVERARLFRREARCQRIGNLESFERITRSGTGRQGTIEDLERHERCVGIESIDRFVIA